MFLILIPLMFAGAFLYYKMKMRKFASVEKMYSGPPALPFVGNGLEFLSNSEGIFNNIMKIVKENKRNCRIWLGPKLFCVFYDHRECEPILSSNTHITKSDVYNYALPWIGYGLLTSTGQRWKIHRRIITPTFHFKILEDFVEIFNKNGAIMCDKLAEHAGKRSFNVYNYVNLAALDNICETAMGMELNAQLNSESTYVRSIKDLCLVFNMRAFKIHLMSDLIFNMTKYATMQKNALEVVHGTAHTMIKTKRKEMEERKNKNSQIKTEDDGINQKKRLAFLDLLLESAEGSQLSDQDIREEVDTFMFEGHDTVSSGISFLLYSLSQNPEVQEKCLSEQNEIFQGSDRMPTYKDLQDMKYLEQVVKEAQRLYPSVPIIAREMHEDLRLNDGFVVPKGAQATLFIYQLHRDPAVFKNPEKFDPENFSPEAMQGRNPYAYVPFAAGPRNCIGQRFAMMEMKATASKVLRRFKLLPCEKEMEAKPIAEIVLISANGINIKLENRQKT